VQLFQYYGFDSQVISASIRSSIHIIQCVEAGTDVVTCPLNTILGLIDHPLTTIGIEKFLADYHRLNK
ncbi:MAG: fructose-6-phosphate aldolase, partial [Bacteroidales bacterium]|nr:fructose-6-phosphate aldolase [Bacteroidales bacterium]